MTYGQEPNIIRCVMQSMSREDQTFTAEAAPQDIYTQERKKQKNSNNEVKKVTIII